MDVVLDYDNALVLQPDVMFISHEREAIIRDFVHGPPDLVVEVTSLGTARYDRTEKSEWYRRYGVREYWLVDPSQHTVTVLDLSSAGKEWTVQARERVRSSVLPLFSHTAAELLGDPAV
jgi:Uma2 family endonuclease